MRVAVVSTLLLSTIPALAQDAAPAAAPESAVAPVEAAAVAPAAVEPAAAPATTAPCDCDCDCDGDKVAARRGRHLFNPTPREAMRELSTDRPDKTESPYSLDAGHFSFETDLATWRRDNGADTIGLNVINLKMGLTSWSDLQLVVGSYQLERGATGGTTGGFGDLTPRLKVNFFGNDGGKVALGTILYATFPTSGPMADATKPTLAGISFPLAVELPGDWALGGMVSYEKGFEDGAGDSLLSMVTVGHDIVEDVGFFAEFYNSAALTGGAPWLATLDFGITWGVTPDVQFDAGAFIGLTDAADDINPFVGLTMRY